LKNSLSKNFKLFTRVKTINQIINKQASKKAREHLDIMLRVITAHNTAKHTRQSERMNDMLTHVAKPHLLLNYARTDLAVKR